MEKETKKKIIKNLDRLLLIKNPIRVVMSFCFLIIFLVLLSICIIGIISRLFVSYFELVVILFILIIATLNIGNYASNLEGLFFVSGVFSLLNFLLLAVGRFNYFGLLSYITFAIAVASSLYYNLWCRRHLIKKWKLKDDKH